MFGLFSGKKREYEAAVYDILEREFAFSATAGPHAPGVLALSQYVDAHYAKGIHHDETALILAATAYSGLLKADEKNRGDQLVEKVGAWLHKTGAPPHVSLHLFESALQLMTDTCKAYYQKEAASRVSIPNARVNPERAVWPHYFMRKDG